MGANNLLVTGPPRCGKSTLIEAVVSKIRRPLTGFFTREILEKGRRTGFKIVTLDGREGILAHDKIKGRLRVGRYGLNLHDLDAVAVPSMIPSTPDEIVVIDEIGKMECYSPLFRRTLIETLDSSNMVIGSIAMKGSAFIEEIKRRGDVRLFVVSEGTRDSLVSSLVAIIENLPTDSA
ncbi:MAG: AAA family ATPase [Desulfomonile tiedjei]|nr:AAA family ATPase [Desulfomonile tiedjei]